MTFPRHLRQQPQVCTLEETVRRSCQNVQIGLGGEDSRGRGDITHFIRHGASNFSSSVGIRLVQHVRSLVSGQWAMMDPGCRSSCLKMTTNYDEAETGMVRMDRLSPVAIARMGVESKLGIALTVSSKVFARSCSSKRGAEGAGGRIGFRAVTEIAMVML